MVPVCLYYYLIVLVSLINASDYFSFAVHYWNYMRTGFKAHKNMTVNQYQLIYKVFEKSCPITEETVLRKLVGSSYWRLLKLPGFAWVRPLPSTPTRAHPNPTQAPNPQNRKKITKKQFLIPKKVSNKIWSPFLDAQIPELFKFRKVFELRVHKQ
jgi:hypothetical protein